MNAKDETDDDLLKLGRRLAAYHEWLIGGSTRSPLVPSAVTDDEAAASEIEGPTLGKPPLPDSERLCEAEYASINAEVVSASGLSSESDSELEEAEDDLDLSDEDFLADCMKCVDLLDRVRRRALPESLIEVTFGGDPDQSDLDAQDDLGNEVVPRKIGRYRILREIGRGGLGVVYEAYDPQLKRSVALKTPREDFLLSKSLRRRFLVEAEAASRLNHPNLVAVYDAGEEAPYLYIASEYCEGMNLAEWLSARTEAVAIHQAVTVVRQLADGVSHAHARGILHRDIKPSNVMLSYDKSALDEPARAQSEGSQSNPLARPTAGERGLHEDREFVVKLGDFGLAKLVDQEVQHTRSGQVLGTVAYMSPEQAEGKSDELDIRTDVYSHGIVLYQLLTGRSPFERESEAATLAAVVNDEPPAPRNLRRDVPRELEAICLKCIAKRKEDRYATANELAQDLDRFLDGKPTIALPATAIKRLLKWVRRRPTLASMMAVVLLSVIGIMTTLAVSNARIRQSLQQVTIADQQRAAEAARTREHLYAADLRYAQDAINQGNRSLGKEVLARYLPNDGSSDLRTWPWYYLWNRLPLLGIPFHGHTDDILDLQFSPDGSELVSALNKGGIGVWDVATRQLKRTMKAHVGRTSCIRFSPLSGKLWSCGSDGMVREWTDEKNRVVAYLSFGLNEMAFSPDGRRLALGDQWGQMFVIDAATGKRLTTWKGHSRVVHVVDFSPDGRWILTAAEDAFARVWSAEDYSKVAEIQVTGKIISGEFAPDSKRFALSLRQSRQIAIASLVQNAERAETSTRVTFDTIPSPEKSAVFQVKGISDDGSRLFGNLFHSEKSEAWIWSHENGLTMLGKLDGPSGSSSATAASADATVIVGQADSKAGPQAFRWTAEEGMMGLGDLPTGEFASEARGVSRDGMEVYGHSTTSYGSELFVWTKLEGTRGTTHWSSMNASTTLLSVADNGRVGLALSSFAGPTPVLLDKLATLEQLFEPPGWAAIHPTVISADGNTISGTCIVRRRKESFQWTRKNGFAVIPNPEADRWIFEPQAISGDGRVIVGQGVSQDRRFAAIWSDGRSPSLPGVEGLMPLETFARQTGIAQQLQGVNLESLNAISRDATTLSGIGTNDQGVKVIWRLELPMDKTLGPITTQRVEMVLENHFDFDQVPHALNWLDDSRLVVGDHGGCLNIMVTTDSTKERSLKVHEKRILAVAIDPRSSRIATGTDDGGLSITAPDNAANLNYPLAIDRNAICIVPSPNDDQLKIGYKSGEVHLLDSITGRVVHRTVPDVTFETAEGFSPSPNGQWIAVCNTLGITHILDATTLKRRHTVKSAINNHALAWTPDTNLLITATSRVHFWNPQNGECVDTLGHPEAEERDGLAVSPDGKMLAISNGPNIEVWDLNRRTQIGTLLGHTRTVCALAFAFDNETLASGSEDYSVRIWNCGTLKSEAVLTGHQSGIPCVAWFPNADTLVSADHFGHIRVWDRRTRQYVLAASASYHVSLNVSKDGRTMQFCPMQTASTLHTWAAWPAGQPSPFQKP